MEMTTKPLNAVTKCAKMMTVKDGWLSCPVCRQNKRLLRILPQTKAQSLTVFCRHCKNEMQVDIDKGQCYLSRS